MVEERRPGSRRPGSGDRQETREQERISPRRISIVTATEPNRRKLHKIVDRLGHSVVELQTDSATGSPNGFPIPNLVICETPASSERDFRQLRRLIKEAWPAPVVVISNKSMARSVTRAMNLGAADYIVQPSDDSMLSRRIADTLALAKHKTGESEWCDVCPAKADCQSGDGPLENKAFLRHHPRAGNKQSSSCSAFVAVSPSMRAIQDTIQRVADSDVTILLTGESGSGKEVVARHIHQCSTRSGQPFVKVNCAALPHHLLESELFGYEKGAFTGATTRRIGKFEAANQGMILLDEISETSTEIQAKLLQVLQDKQFHRLGSNEDIHVDVQVLAASNKRLEHQVDEGKFREDLFFRLKVIELNVPPLRERRDEIPLFVEYFSCRFSRQYRKPKPKLSERLFDLLMNDPWPGNVRELENAIKRIVILGEEETVLRELLARRGKGNARSSPESLARVETTVSGTTKPVSLIEVGRRAALAAERALMLQTLNNMGWNRRKAAKILGVSYKTLLNKMKESGLG